ncbi:MAG: bifunctional diaminohydroxyphosphoribosylaminopyrimidine deaminase/5-amino-6-(5-phosphoribosylamino)uracil reductase RibD [Clostridiales bacterium]|nr:bifunctional diaminohydroxyphosphoribosylaminopyrimidine deaminase/5-amino-6-(5-phosphoribosylamino)uracil reductase RibD [Candidatus Crickella merdequi]
MTDRDYMERALELAVKATGWTNPNPLVGAVIGKDGRIIGEGYHHRKGEPHAERNAIASLTESAEGATIYVTMEPCCHYGLTPPCTEAIIENRIAKVVIGSRDPNPKVAGKGVLQLREAGIEVVEDFMREECDAINEVFFHYITTNTPYVVMKYAMTADGKIATRTGESKWVTGPEAREAVHQMRNKYMGIMVGIGTVLADNPMLNARIDGARDPIRIICDSNLRIPMDCQIVKTAKEIRTIVACACNADNLRDKRDALTAAGVEIIDCPDGSGRIDLKKLMELLGAMKIDSVLIEGGGTLNYSALEAGIVNEVAAFIAPKLWGGSEAKTPVEGIGVELPAEGTELELADVKQVGRDILIRYRKA